VKKKNYHNSPTVTFRLESPDHKSQLEDYAKKHRVSVGWIMKKAIDMFWEAVKTEKIKL
jgi:predicted transcriptional regulator